MSSLFYTAGSNISANSTAARSIISDSGITRYKVITDTRIMYGKASEPYTYFPDGVYFEKFDTVFNVEASVKADTAYFYERRKIWRLVGNVDITNLEGKRFQTSELFWDQQKKIVYSDSSIRATEGDKVNRGIGFISNENFTKVTIFNPSAEIPVETQRRPLQSDSISP